jgi:excisionase family DNA binding protein
MVKQEFLTIKQAAQFLKINQEAVLKMIKKGQIKAVKIGQSFNISKRDLEIITGEILSSDQKKIIDQGIKKITTEYRTTLKLLEQEQI